MGKFEYLHTKNNRRIFFFICFITFHSILSVPLPLHLIVMATRWLALCLFLCLHLDTARARDPDLWCGACKGLFDEIEYLLSQGACLLSPCSFGFCSVICSANPIICLQFTQRRPLTWAPSESMHLAIRRPCLSRMRAQRHISPK